MNNRREWGVTTLSQFEDNNRNRPWPNENASALWMRDEEEDLAWMMVQRQECGSRRLSKSNHPVVLAFSINFMKNTNNGTYSSEAQASNPLVEVQWSGSSEFSTILNDQELEDASEDQNANANWILLESSEDVQL